MVAEKGSKKPNIETLRILDVLIKQGNGFLQSDTEIPTRILTAWHAHAGAIITKVAGSNSRDARELKRIHLGSSVIADQYFRKHLGQFVKNSRKDDKVIEMPRSKKGYRRRAIAEVKDILLGIKLKLRDQEN